MQGRGTAAYTPMEQYGEDDSHTDVRSDIYSLGATLYHLLTNQAPAEAKQRFLKPQSLARPRDVNPAISEPIERGILAAIEMHPDDRPNTIAELRSVLFADGASWSVRKRTGVPSAAELLRENALWFALAGIAILVGFAVTLLR